MYLTGKAGLAGVIGWPVSHSKSPRLHGYWLEHYGIDGAYVPLPVRPGDLETVLRALPRMGFRGVNLTLPHKEQALAMVDHVEPLAQRIGAVNTVVIAADGSLEGRNADAFGFIENLRQRHPTLSLSASPAVVLGAGGAARAVIVALLDAGCPEIRLANRTQVRGIELAEDLAGTKPGVIRPVAWEERDAALDGAGLLVNTTQLGMVGQPELSLDLFALPESAVVADIVYTPLQTRLLARAAARGNPVVDGLGMLLHQARPGFAAWFGVMPEVDEGLRSVMGES